MITGHGHGGTRAALVSMYFEKKLGRYYEAVTFGAPGALCWARNLDHGGNLLDDVDPFIMHSQITDYVHPLDITGHLDYDPGNMCLVGTTNIECSPTAAFCEQVYGHTATEIGAAVYDPGLGRIGLLEDSDRCSYFTHYWLGEIGRASCRGRV